MSGHIGKSTLYRYPFPAMGSFGSVSVWADDEGLAESAADEAIREVHRIERKYSRYLEDSVLSTFNRYAARGIAVDVDDETADLLDYAAACYTLSDGMFDITSGVLRRAWDFQSRTLPDPGLIGDLLPLVGFKKLAWTRPTLRFEVPGMEIDFGGIGKEYAVDRALAVLDAAGIESALVDLGGDVGVSGPLPDGSPWRVAIGHPRDADATWRIADLCQGGIATSGDYERGIVADGRRYGHILSPLTGWPVEGLASATVIADHCLIAGTFATMALLKGAAGPAWLKTCGRPSLWMDAEGAAGGDIGSG